MKLQSAMEYLMTYGWAILIIAVVIVALITLGIFSGYTFAPKSQPGSCTVVRNDYGGASLSGQCTGAIPDLVISLTTQVANVVIPSSPTLAIGPSAPMTISGWIQPSACTYNSEAFGTIVYDQAGTGQRILISNSCKLEFQLSSSSPTVISGVVSTTGWTFFTAVYDGSNIYLYTDGALASSSPESAAVAGSGSFLIGYSPEPYQYTGYISNIQLYNTSLSANSIQALYFEGVGGTPINLQNLAGWWPLNGNADDYSGNSNDGTTVGTSYLSNWWSNYIQP